MHADESEEIFEDDDMWKGLPPVQLIERYNNALNVAVYDAYEQPEPLRKRSVMGCERLQGLGELQYTRLWS